jgi:hypothetical protein
MAMHYKLKTEGGSGGKRGHSNMCHGDYTEVIKACARRQRRIQSRRMERVARLGIEGDR